MKSILLTVGLLGLLAVGSKTPASAQDTAATPTSCGGLDEYATAMLEAGADWTEAAERDGLLGRDIETYSAPEWIAFATNHDTLQTAIKRIEPPAFAADWHQVEVERLGLGSSLARAVATGGVFAAPAFFDELDEINARGKTAYSRASASCPGFAGFYDRWDLLGVDAGADATPQATPGA